MSEAPFVSVVVPTASRPLLLADCLAALEQQDYPRERFEVLVVLDGVDPESLRVAGAAAGNGLAVRMIERERGGPGSARNSGIAEADGDPICFLDDDALAPPGWLSAIVAGALRNPSAGLVGGPVRPRFEGSAPRTCSRHELAGATLDLGPHDLEVDEVWGCNMAVRRHAADHVGGFDERLRLAEDWDWGNRLVARGGKIVYVPEAWICHRRVGTDLRLLRLPGEFVRRGWIVGRRRARVDAAAEARTVLRSLRHALRTRCARGLTDACRSLGLLSAALVPRRGAEPPAG